VQYSAVYENTHRVTVRSDFGLNPGHVTFQDRFRPWYLGVGDHEITAIRPHQILITHWQSVFKSSVEGIRETNAMVDR
jgi:hypothetical protein